MKKLLLLEDNISDINLSELEIKKQWPDIDIVICKRIADARKLMTGNNKFDIAIFDLKLSDGNGMDLLVELRELKCTTPIIILTGEGSEEIATKALKLGANNYISKKYGFHKTLATQIEFTINSTFENTKHLSVLYVEHNKSDIDLTKYYFKRNAPHIHFKFVNTGEEALKIIFNENGDPFNYDLLLLDYQLPGLNALEITKYIRYESSINIPIVIITGQGDESIVVEALKIGANDYVLKSKNYLFRLPSLLTIAYQNSELKKKNSALHESETKLRLLADYAADWEYWVNPDGDYIYNSPMCENISGYKPDDFIKNKHLLTDITHPDYHKMVKKHFLIKKPKGLHKPIEFIIKTASGKEEWISHFCRPVFDDENKFMGKRGVNRCITNQKKSEAALLESEEKFRSAFEESAVAMMMGLADGSLIKVNRAMSQIFGYSEKELLTKHMRDLTYTEDLSTSSDVLDSLSKGTTSTSLIEKRYKHKDGHIIWGRTTLSPVKDVSGKTIFNIGQIEDITERKRDEQLRLVLYNISNAIVSSDNLEHFIQIIQKQLSAVIDTTNFFVALYDVENDTMSLPFFDDEEEDIVSFPAGKTLSKYVVQTKKSLIGTKKKLKELEQSGDVELYGKPSEIWLGVPLKVENEGIGVLAVQSYTDESAFDELDMKVLEFVSDQIGILIHRKKAADDIVIAYEKATESDRLKTAFLQNISHEIRTPMNGIMGFSTLLKDTKLTGDEQQTFVDVILKSGNRMLNTLNDIMDMSRLETEQVKLNLSVLNINNTVLTLYDFFKPEAENKGLSFSFSITLPDEEANIIVDEEKLNGILSNIIKNAIKYTHEGSIEFGYKNSDDEIIFFVTDTGIGIPKDRQDAIFERFIQADIEDSKAYQGSGLGLSIAKAYSEMFEGSLWVESEVGIGSKFYFSMVYKPFKKKLKASVDIVDSKTAENKIRKFKILIVEDEEFSDEYLSIVLDEVSNEILHAETGIDAIELCKEYSDIDLILMDIKMPIMDGYKATKEIRKFNKEVIIIGQTAYALPGDREKSIEAGCNDYITKPIDKDKLMSMVNNLL